jgi:hypothetical protein
MENPSKESSRNLKEGKTQRKMDGWSKVEHKIIIIIIIIIIMEA